MLDRGPRSFVDETPLQAGGGGVSVKASAPHLVGRGVQRISANPNSLGGKRTDKWVRKSTILMEKGKVNGKVIGRSQRHEKVCAGRSDPV